MRRKIVLPFMFLFLAGFGALIALSLWLGTRSVEERLRAEVRNLAEVLSPQRDLLLAQPTIDRVRKALRADGVGYGTWVRTGESPFFSASGRLPRKAADLGPLPADPAQSVTPTPFRAVEFDGGRYQVTCAPLEYGGTGPNTSCLFVLYEDAALRREKLAAMRPLIVVSAIGLLVVAWVGVRIARNLAAPIEQLAASTEALAKGDFEHKVDIASEDEIGRLAASFNSMLDAIRRLQDERVRAEKLAALGQVTAGIAHEIRNPLTAMKMTLQILLDAEPAGDRRESLSVVLKEAERLQLAVDGLLAYAKPPALSLAPANLNDVVRGALGVLDAQVKHIGVSIETGLGDLPRVPLDASRMHQVVVNLLLNAVQAAGADGCVKVVTDSCGDKVRLSITDSGPGIPAEARPRVFEPFFTTKTGGIGLGLAVSKRLVDDHGGSLTFDGTPGRTTFVVELPAAR